MRNFSIRLYSVAAPLLVLPLMGFGFDQVVPYLKGAEFRVILAELLTQVASGIVDAIITVGLQSLFT